MERIAIVGMGISGTGVLTAYEKEVDTSKLKIDCYDLKNSFGRGYPFREDSEELILNLRTDKISYDYRDLKDLGKWYRENNFKNPEYPSRARFGRYMKSRLDKTVENTNANVIYEKVVRIDKLCDGWEVEDQAGNINEYDRVHLCNGVLSQKYLYGLENNDHYINYVYPVEEKLASISNKDKVLVIGAGLTAIDIVTYLLHEKNIENISMFSRTNIMPTVRGKERKVKINYLNMTLVKEILRANYGRISFEEFDSLFLKELTSHGIDYKEFLKTHMQGGVEGLLYNIDKPQKLGIVQSLLPYMNLVLNKVWDSMTLSDRKKFKEKYHLFISLNRSPLQFKSAEILIKAFKEKKLRLEKNIKSVSVNDKGKFVLIDKKGEKLETGKEYDFAVNGTGFDRSLEKIEEVNPLLRQLLDKRYIMVDDNGGISVLPASMQVISPRFGTLDKFHAHGVLTSGVQYRNNSAMIIQLTARWMIKELYK